MFDVTNNQSESGLPDAISESAEFDKRIVAAMKDVTEHCLADVAARLRTFGVEV